MIDPDDPYSQRDLDEAREAGARHEKAKQTARDVKGLKAQIDDLEDDVDELEKRSAFKRGVWHVIAVALGAIAGAISAWAQEHLFE